jgi:hypothetical protein
MSEGETRTYNFHPIRSLDTTFPVSASLSESFGDLTKRFCALYKVSGGSYIIGKTYPSPATPLSSLAPNETEICVWLNPHSHEPIVRQEEEEEPEPVSGSLLVSLEAGAFDNQPLAEDD